MDFASNYFNRYPHREAFFNNMPDSQTGIIVVIPCYDDEFIFQTLQSLQGTEKTQSGIEVIVVVNSGMHTPRHIIEKNRKIFDTLQLQRKNKQYTRFNLLAILIEDVPKKQAGVGYARKTGMDETVRRFAARQQPRGIIASLDADCIVCKDYFVSLEKSFNENKKQGAFVLQFQHDFNDKIYTAEEINACRLYETYLRYFRLALKITGYPHCFHTVGSCFAVDVVSYTKAGGMSSRQGGEDFYFLHKLAQLTEVGTINKTMVYPSPRISNRVPFGTGPTVNHIIKSGSYTVYNFNLYFLLKDFFCLYKDFFYQKQINIESVPTPVREFIGEEKLIDIVVECKNNSKEEDSFRKRFFSHFNALFIVKFLNSFDEKSAYPPAEILDAANKLLNFYNNEDVNYSIENIYVQLLQLDIKNT